MDREAKKASIWVSSSRDPVPGATDVKPKSTCAYIGPLGTAMGGRMIVVVLRALRRRGLKREHESQPALIGIIGQL
jgi:hypothetical protein